MSSETMQEAIRASDPRELAKQIVLDLDLPSPLIGAEGPPDHTGPEEKYVRALDGADDQVREKFAEAVRIVLLEDAAEIVGTGTVRRPFLLYNLFSLLEAVELPKVPEVLQNLRDQERPLREALADQNDDLYAQLLIAHAVNQHRSKQDVDFWLSLLDHQSVDYVSAGIVGLRESGWETALTYLPKVKALHERYPELGPFEDEVMLVVDTYPDQNWPDCARDHVVDRDIMELIKKHGQDRYVPAIEELEGPAVEIIRQAGKVEEVRRSREKWNIGSPALALAGSPNGR
jgi:hypothetical protein